MDNYILFGSKFPDFVDFYENDEHSKLIPILKDFYKMAKEAKTSRKLLLLLINQAIISSVMSFKREKAANDDQLKKNYIREFKNFVKVREQILKIVMGEDFETRPTFLRQNIADDVDDLSIWGKMNQRDFKEFFDKVKHSMHPWIIENEDIQDTLVELDETED